MLSAYSSEYLQTDASDVWELFFETHLIWDISNNVHTLQNPHCKNIWWNYNKNESFKSYLGNKEQKLLFLVVSQSDMHIDFHFLRSFFCAPDGAILFTHPKNRAPRRKFVQPYITFYSLIFLVRKQMWEHEKNKWKMELYSSWILLCVWSPLI